MILYKSMRYREKNVVSKFSLYLKQHISNMLKQIKK